MKKLKIGFIYNLKDGRGAEEQIEWDSPETIEAISNALAKIGAVTRLNANENIEEKIIAAAPDIVFNYAEGLNGEEREAEIPFLLERLSIPYTGSGPRTMINSLNKAKTKKILNSYNIKTAPFSVVENLSENLENLNFPCIVKPLWEGSSKGIHDRALAGDAAGALKLAEEIIIKYKQPALVEEFLPGDEFTCGVIGNKPRTRVLPVAAINHGALEGKLNPILSFEAKWVLDTPSNPLQILSCPAPVDGELYRKLEDISLKAYNALECRDWCRIDIRLDSRGEPNILELNPIPGLLPLAEDNSCLPAAARAAGISYDELIEKVLYSALERNKLSTKK